MATSGPADPISPLFRWGLPALVFAATFAAFGPALAQGLVELDDDRNFLQNEAYRSFSAASLRWMFTQSWYGHYQPLSWVTLALDYQLWGLDGRGYHATNMLLHALGAVALYALAVALLRPFARDESQLRTAAALAALLHAIHPLRVESVAWATERRDVQSGLFLLLSVLGYVRMARAERRRWPWLALALLAFVASLLSKAWGITLPAVLLVLDVGPLRRRSAGASWSRLLGEKVLFLLPALLVAWKAAAAQESATARVPLSEHGIADRLAQAGYGLAFYVGKTLWPRNLSALYWLELDFDPARPIYLFTGALAVGATLALVALRRRWPAGLAAWAIYAIVVAPVLGFLQSGFQKVADRYTYLACIPFAVLAGAGLARLERRWFRAGAAVTAGLLALLGGLSWRQTLVWRDSETLFRNVVAVEPDNYFGWHNLAVILHKDGRFDEAIEAEKSSIRHHPGKGNEMARYNLGNLYRLKGMHAEALEAYRGAVEVAPDHHESLRIVVADLCARGDLAGGEALLERAIAHDPRFLEGYADLAALHQQRGRWDQAVNVWRRAVAVDPGWHQARHRLGVALFEAGRLAEAEEHLWAAQKLNIYDPEYVIDLARLFAQTGRAQDALRWTREVLRQFPGHPRATVLQRQLEGG